MVVQKEEKATKKPTSKKIEVPLKDTGSSQSQIIILTKRISSLTDHLKKNKKDFSTKKRLLDLVGIRARLLKYFSRKDLLACQKLCQELSIRRHF